jgi:hypothetical protein
MTNDSWPSAAELLDGFSDEVSLAGGFVKDSFAGPTGTTMLLIARAVLPTPREVAPGDRLQGGVAIRATDEELCIHPYVFRQVCTNGAIMAHAIETRVIRRGEAFDVMSDVREAIRECCADEAFGNAAEQIRAARRSEVDVLLTLMPFLSRMPSADSAGLLRQVMVNLARERDSSAFGVMQAITATARDTRDPELRWRLEALGGSVPALALTSPRRGTQPTWADVVEEPELAAVV